jgi:hypothetical protein
VGHSEEFLFHAWRRAEHRLDAAIAAWAVAASASLHDPDAALGAPTFEDIRAQSSRVDRLRDRYLAASES